MSHRFGGGCCGKVSGAAPRRGRGRATVPEYSGTEETAGGARAGADRSRLCGAEIWKDGARGAGRTALLGDSARFVLHGLRAGGIERKAAARGSGEIETLQIGAAHSAVLHSPTMENPVACIADDRPFRCSPECRLRSILRARSPAEYRTCRAWQAMTVRAGDDGGWRAPGSDLVLRPLRAACATSARAV